MKANKKFIITDPCYILDRDQYQAIGTAMDWEMEKIKVPSEYKRIDGEVFTLHRIDGTPNGDGSYTYKGQEIGVDAGLLCIAECWKGWKKERSGAIFTTLKEAQEAWPIIRRHF